MGLIAGRPTLDVILEHQNASNRTRFITAALQRSSPLLQLLEFDASTVPNARSRSIIFNYERRNTVRVAQLRNWYQDYQPQYITGSTPGSAVLRPIGDAFEIDRVFGDADPEYIGEQIEGMAPGIGALMSDLIINGNNTSDAREFDGLSKILTGTAQEISGTGINLAGAQSDGDLREWLGSFRREINKMRALGLIPVILGNDLLIHRLQMAGEQLKYVNLQPDQFGVNQIASINGAFLVDVGVTNLKDGSNNVISEEIIPVVSVVGPPAKQVTDMYIVGMSRSSGFTGLTLAGGQGRPEPVQYRTTPGGAGVVRRFEAEVVAGVALLDARAAVVYRGIRVG